MDAKAVLDVCRRLSGNKEVYYATPADVIDPRGQPNYKLLFAGDEVADDYVTLFRHLPDLAQQHVVLADKVRVLSTSIDALRTQVDQLKSAVENPPAKKKAAKKVT